MEREKPSLWFFTRERYTLLLFEKFQRVIEVQSVDVEVFLSLPLQLWCLAQELGLPSASASSCSASAVHPLCSRCSGCRVIEWRLFPLEGLTPQGLYTHLTEEFKTSYCQQWSRVQEAQELDLEGDRELSLLKSVCTMTWSIISQYQLSNPSCV